MTRASRLPLQKPEKRRRKYPEHELHKTVVKHLRQRAIPGLLWFHPVNEGKRGPLQAGRLKDIGLVAGVSDLILVLPPYGRICALELKAHGNKPTEDQLWFLGHVAFSGGLSGRADNIDKALDLLEAWGALKPNLNRPRYFKPEQAKQPSISSKWPSTGRKAA
jgi:hypothetical protein